jgi:hypothetical protein
MGPSGIEPRAALTAFGFGPQSGGAGTAADPPDRLATDGYPRIPAGRKLHGCQRQRHVFAGVRFWNELGLGGEPVKGRNDVQASAGRPGLRVAVRSLA